MYSRQVVWRERHTSRQGGKQKEGKNKGEVEREEKRIWGLEKRAAARVASSSVWTGHSCTFLDAARADGFMSVGCLSWLYAHTGTLHTPVSHLLCSQERSSSSITVH